MKEFTYARITPFNYKSMYFEEIDIKEFIEGMDAPRIRRHEMVFCNSAELDSSEKTKAQDYDDELWSVAEKFSPAPPLPE